MNTVPMFQHPNLVKIDVNSPRKVGRLIQKIHQQEVCRVLTWNPATRRQGMFKLKEFSFNQIRPFTSDSKSTKFLKRYFETYNRFKDGINSFPEIDQFSLSTYSDTTTGITHLLLNHLPNGELELKRYRIGSDGYTFLDLLPGIELGDPIPQDYFLPGSIYDTDNRKISDFEKRLDERVEETIKNLS